MQNTTNQAKPTPTRRRHGRNGGGKAAAQKMYASENDVPNVTGSVCEQPGHPQTPQKSHSGSPEPQSVTGNHNGSKQRTRNKPRAKNNSTLPSPDVVRQNRRSTPQSIPIYKANSVQAFAGATFHASPAASALPMPSFYSKSIPESPGNPARRPDVRQQPSPPATDREAPTPSYPSTAPTARESPLDAIFRADRAEKERARRASSLHTSARPQCPVSPPRDSPFAATQHNTHPGHAMPFRRSSSGISVAELDGLPGKPLGPAFSTPYQERIRAARGNSNQPITSEAPPSEDRSEALKKYLFGAKGPAASPQSTPPRSSAPYANHGTIGNRGHVEEGRSADLRAMEDNLRRILKLDSPLATGKPTERPLYS
ncbi:proteophosphoglycan 5 [Colletotrichum plurivorum]|uniref:Proteophosphoglycan 5 n=1 Tax=Colletotrichum plurivorum TaxID=2175906 RepID=A0A8H6JI17_9PEZI|nr:proteophosphoglycan 5 [Colletotrichum plurivorum]